MKRLMLAVALAFPLIGVYPAYASSAVYVCTATIPRTPHSVVVVHTDKREDIYESSGYTCTGD